jgi:hypothetical protein
MLKVRSFFYLQGFRVLLLKLELLWAPRVINCPQTLHGAALSGQPTPNIFAFNCPQPCTIVVAFAGSSMGSASCSTTCSVVCPEQVYIRQLRGLQLGKAHNTRLKAHTQFVQQDLGAAGQW